MERFQKERQLGDLFSHEIGNPGVDWILVFLRHSILKLEVTSPCNYRRGRRTALPEARMPPYPSQYEPIATRHRSGIWCDDVRRKTSQRQRQKEEEQNSQCHEAIRSDRLRSSS